MMRRHEPQAGHHDTSHHSNSVIAFKTNSLPIASGRRSSRLSAIGIGRTRSALVLVDIFDRVANGGDLLGGIVRYLDPEFFLERHNQLDDIEEIGRASCRERV